MQIILIVLAVIFIPIIVNMYIFAIDLKRNGKKNITVKMVLDEIKDLSFLFLFPGISIFGMLIVLGWFILDLVKNVRLL